MILGKWQFTEAPAVMTMFWSQRALIAQKRVFDGNTSSATVASSHNPTVALLDPSPSPSNCSHARALTSLSIGALTAGATSLPRRNATTSTNIPVTGLCSPLHSNASV